MSAILANTGANDWNTGGAWVGAVQPTAADDVTIPATASVNIPAAVTAVARSVTIQASGTVIFAATTSVLTIGDGTAGAGNVALSVSASATITLTGIGTINFISTSATQQTITSGGKTLPNYTINGAGSSYLLSDDNISSGIVTLTAGTFNTNNKTCTWVKFVGTGASTRTLTSGSSAISVSSIATDAWGITSGGLTVTANTAVVTLTGANAGLFIGSGDFLTGMSFVFTGSGIPNINGATGAVTIANVTRIGTAVKTDGFNPMSNTGSLVVTGTFTVTGNSAINRVLLAQGTPGSTRSITAAAVSLTNVDVMDITGAGAATWTGTSLGNCLGNSGITFTTPETQTHTASAGGNWSDVTKWTSRVPLPQDNVIVDGTTTGTLSADMPRLGADITFTGFVGTWSLSSFGSNTMYGSFTAGTGMTISASANLIVAGRSSLTFTTNGVNMATGYVQSAPGGTYTLQGALTATNQSFNITAGTFNSNNFNITAGPFTSSGSITRAINLGTTTYTFVGSSTTPVNIASTGLTLSASSSTIIISSALTSARTFAGAGLTYGTLTYTVANSPGSLTITGANTFTTLNVASGRILTMPSTTTNTVTNFNVNGAVNGYIYLPGVAANYASTPDSAALSITGDITIDVKVAPTAWIPTPAGVFLSKLGAAGNYSYDFFLDATGNLVFRTSADGTALLSNTSTVATGLTNGAVKWARVSLDVNDGGGNRVCRFYLSDDGTTWTQLGATVTTAGVAACFDGTAPLEIGTNQGGLAPLGGKFYNAKVYNSDLQTSSGTPVFNADFTTKTVGANTFTESSSNAATVTINGVLAQAGDGRVSLVSSSGGSAATMTSTNQQSVSYLSIQDSTVNASPKWYAGANSVNVSGNTNWLFVAPPSSGSGGGGGTGFKSLLNLQNIRSV